MDQYVINVDKKSYGRTNDYNYAVSMYFTAIRTFPDKEVTIKDIKNNLTLSSSHKNHGILNTTETGRF